MKTINDRVGSTPWLKSLLKDAEEIRQEFCSSKHNVEFSRCNVDLNNFEIVDVGWMVDNLFGTFAKVLISGVGTSGRIHFIEWFDEKLRERGYLCVELDFEDR